MINIKEFMTTTENKEILHTEDKGSTPMKPQKRRKYTKRLCK